MISLMYSLRMFNDSGSILVYAIKGPKLTKSQHLTLRRYGRNTRRKPKWEIERERRRRRGRGRRDIPNNLNKCSAP